MYFIHRGFTLLESMIVMAVMALILSLAVPSMVDFRSASQVDSVQRNLISVMNTGRNLAINNGARVSLCGSSDGVHCDGVWNQWLLLTGDVPASTVAITPIQRGDAGNTPLQADATSVTWQSTGETNTSLQVDLCTPDADSRRFVSLSQIGRPRGSLDMDRDGIHLMPSGSCT